MTDHVALRPMTVADLPIIEAVYGTEEAASFNWYGFEIPARFRRALVEDRSLGDNAGMLAVVARSDGRMVGNVSWQPRTYGSNLAAVAINIGIGLLPGERGKGYGSMAQAALADYLFAQTTVNRVEALTDVANPAEQRALEKAGFVREGVLIGAQFRNGKWNDLVSYSIVRNGRG
jgi:RimJ/RimL family protein N-acetyltransferase